MSYSRDIRVRVARAVAEGVSRRAAAQRFAVSASSAVRWAARAAAHGEPKAHKSGRPAGKGPLLEHLAFLVAAVEETPDMTMPELARGCCRRAGLLPMPLRCRGFCAGRASHIKKAADGVGVRSR